MGETVNFDSSEKLDILIKQVFGFPSTSEKKQWYEETSVVFNNYINGENIFIDSIPNIPDFDICGTVRTANEANLDQNDFISFNANNNDKVNSSIVDDSTGTVRRFRYLILNETPLLGSDPGASWFKTDNSSTNILTNAFQFNLKQYFENGITYQPYLYSVYTEESLQTGANFPYLPFGKSGGNWNFDIKSGILFFSDFNNLSNTSIQSNAIFQINNISNRPVLTFYKYIGRIGIKYVNEKIEVLQNQIINLEISSNSIDNSNNEIINNLLDDISNIKTILDDLSGHSHDLSGLITDVSINKYDISNIKQNIYNIEVSFNLLDISNIVSQLNELSGNVLELSSILDDISINKYDISLNKYDLSLNKYAIENIKQDLNTLNTHIILLNNQDVLMKTDINYNTALIHGNSININLLESKMISLESLITDVCNNILDLNTNYVNNVVNDISNTINEVKTELYSHNILIKGDIVLSNSNIEYNRAKIELLENDFIHMVNKITVLESNQLTKQEFVESDLLLNLYIQNNLMKSDILLSNSNINYYSERIELIDKLIENLYTKLNNNYYNILQIKTKNIKTQDIIVTNISNEIVNDISLNITSFKNNSKYKILLNFNYISSTLPNMLLYVSLYYKINDLNEVHISEYILGTENTSFKHGLFNNNFYIDINTGMNNVINFYIKVRINNDTHYLNNLNISDESLYPKIMLSQPGNTISVEEINHIIL